MLDRTINVKVNALTKRDLEAIAKDWGVAPSAIYRRALYEFLAAYEAPGNDALILRMEDMHVHGGSMPEDSVVDIQFESEPTGKEQPTMPAPPEVLADLARKADEMNRGVWLEMNKRRVEKMNKRIAEAKARLAESKPEEPSEDKA